MEAPKYIVCMQGVEGFVAEYGDLDLALARAKELCTAHADTFVLSPVRHFRRTGKTARLIEQEPTIAPAAEQLVVAEQVLGNRRQGIRRGPTSEEGAAGQPAPTP